MKKLLSAYQLFFLGYGAYQSLNNHHTGLINQKPESIEQLVLTKKIFSQGVFNCISGIVLSATGIGFLSIAFLSSVGNVRFLSGVGAAISHELSKKALFEIGFFGIYGGTIGAAALAYDCTDLGEGSMDIFQSLNASRP